MIPTCEILIGDVRAKLAELRARGLKAQCCVTSPPYWALRDYGTAPQVWGGAGDCLHEWGETLPGRNAKPDRSVTGHDASGSGTFGDDAERGAQGQKAARGAALKHGQFCQRCGAWLGELGLEPTPELFVEHIVEVFRDLWDVLADDGTLWMNFGDSYVGSPGNQRGGDEREGLTRGGSRPHRSASDKRGPGLKSKDLVGMPWRVAFALQASGWYLRQEIIWAKPNPMPESVSDRCTKAHEHIFLLTKRPSYYFDADAIREPVTGNANRRSAAASEFPSGLLREGEARRRPGVNPKAAKVPNGWDTGAGAHGSFHREGRANGTVRPKQNESFAAAVCDLVQSRNKRSVWSIPTEAYSEAHYATFPRDLVRPCILAGSRPGDVVIDIFGGSGTTAAVALEYGRNAVLIDLNPANEVLMRGRTAEHDGQAVMPGLISGGAA